MSKPGQVAIEALFARPHQAVACLTVYTFESCLAKTADNSRTLAYRPYDPYKPLRHEPQKCPTGMNYRLETAPQRCEYWVLNPNA